MSLAANGSGGEDSDIVEEFEIEIDPVVQRRQVPIPLPNKRSTWANIDPANPCVEKEKEAPPVERRRSHKEKSASVTTEADADNDRSKKVARSHKSKKVAKAAKGKKKTDNNNTDDAADDEETYDVEMVLNHRKSETNSRKCEYLVRWLGYDSTNDTWEPETNFIGDYAKEQLKLYLEKIKPVSRDGESNEKVETPKRSKKKRLSTAEEKNSVPSKKKHIDNAEEEEPKSQFSNSSDSAGDPNDETNHNWFGIKEEDTKANREFKNLYVSNRVLTPSEKLLAEFGSNSAGRVTRSSLKPLKEDVEPPLERSSKTPPPAGKRRRITESPAPKYSPEPPNAKRVRKSMPAVISTKSTEKKEMPVRTASVSAKEQIKIAAEVVVEEKEEVEVPKVVTKIVRPPPVLPPTPAAAPPEPVTSQNTNNNAPFPSTSVPVRQYPFIAPIKVYPVMRGTVYHPPAQLPILDPRAKKPQMVPRNVSYRDEDPYVADSEEYDSSNEAENETIINQNLHSSSFSGLKAYSSKPYDAEKTIADIQGKSLKEVKLVTTYDDFVAAVIGEDCSTVHATLTSNPEAFNLNDRDNMGRTLLHHIALQKCKTQHAFDAITKILVQKGAELTFTDSSSGWTPLHAAVANNKLCMVETLMELNSPVNTVDKNKETPLITAIRAKNVSMVKVLVRGGANINQIDENEEIDDEVQEVLDDHRLQVNICMDNSRSSVLPQAVNNKGAVTKSMYITPVGESRFVEYTFNIVNAADYQKPNNYLIFECALIDIDKVDGHVNGRLWQQSPIRKILINDMEPINLHKTTNFLSLPQLRAGKNVVKIELMNQMYVNTTYCLATRLCHLFMAGFSKVRKLDPVTKNLMPLAAGGHHAQVPASIRQLTGDLKMRYLTPLLPLSRQNTPAKKILAKQLVASGTDRVEPVRPPPPTVITIPTTRPSPIAGNSTHSHSSSPLAGFIPLRKAGLNTYQMNRAVPGGSRSMVTPLTAANNRIAVRQTQPATATKPVLQPQLNASDR